MLTKRSTILACLVSSLFLFSACQQKVRYAQVQETRLAMGTLVEITVIDSTEEEAKTALEAGFAEIERIAKLFWEGNPNGPVYAFNHRQTASTPMPREVLGLIARSCEYSRRLNGAFDITVAVLFPLYRFSGENLQPPTISAINARLKYIDYRTLQIDSLGERLGAKWRQTQIGFGAVAKGYAVDRALEKIKAHGVVGALVNAGGDLRTLPRLDGKKWRIGIQHPRQINKLFTVLEIDSMAVVTSGDYEKFFMYNGKRIHHLLNPHTGFPADSCQAVTVIASNAEQADAMATGLFVLGANAGQEALKQFPDCAALWIRQDGSVVQSPGFEKYIVAEGNN